jgi:hypothetical protein
VTVLEPEHPKALFFSFLLTRPSRSFGRGHAEELNVGVSSRELLKAAVELCARGDLKGIDVDYHADPKILLLAWGGMRR